MQYTMNTKKHKTGSPKPSYTKTKSDKTGSPKPPYTITKDNIFKKQTHFQSFYNEDAYDAYMKNLVYTNKDKLYLFAEEINEDSVRRFFPIDHESIYLFSKDKKAHLYEYFKENEKIKLYLDIDIKKHNIPEGLSVDKLKVFFDNLLDECITVVTNELKKYGIENPKIVIESSNRSDKLSAHVKFTDVVFPGVYHIKYFMSCIDHKFISNGILDPSVYKKGSFRMLWNSKVLNGVNLEFYKGINYIYEKEKGIGDKQLFMDCLLKCIPEKYQYVDIKLPTNTKIAIKKIPKMKKILLDNKEVNQTEELDLVFQPVDTLKKYMSLIDDKRLEHYMTWYDVGRFLHNCNPSKACFQLWDEWSKKYMDNYNSYAFNVSKWNDFKFGYCSIGSLKKLVKEDNPEKYAELEYSIEKQVFETIQFNSNYLLNDENESIKSKKSFISTYVDQWQKNKNIKTLAIKSTYDTGKSRLIGKIIEEYNVERVLFVSYRQTLTNELHGSFSKLQVKSYIDKEYKANRIICQIESLHKLLPKLEDLSIESDIEVPSYDLIVLDEIESILAHFRSSTIHNKEDTFNLLVNIIKNSNKILALDGDFGNRSFDFINSFNTNNIILENTCKKNKRHYILTNNRGSFDENIDADLKKGLNIGIVSMSSKLATYYYNKYKEVYKCVLHCSRSDDDEKDNLKNVKKHWLQFQMVAYSPSVECGVNFDIEHFTKIYVVLSSKSTCPRGLLQMCSRIRKLKDTNIMVYLNNLPFRTKSCFYTYSELKEYISEACNKYLKPEYIKNEENKIIIKYRFDLYAQILVHNETENANKTKNLFVPYFLQLLLDKGHTFEYVDIRRNNNGLDKDNVTKNEIIKSEDIDADTFNYFLKLQRNNNATKEIKLAIERYIFKKEWNVKELTEEFINRYYGKTHILHNLRCLYGGTQIEHYIVSDKLDNILEFDKISKIEQVNMIKEVIKILGYIKPGEKLSKDVFEANKNKVVSESKFFVNSIKSQMLFGYDKLTVSKIKSKSNQTIRQFMGFINSVLCEWGLVIKTNKKSSSTKINDKKITINTVTYELSYIDNIDNYM